ncbi:MAG: hypothetical protein NUW21_07995 [Elusimicrobia bacterium]|nr:hypothetical protein [Elusimicrobiota bacterium]
MRSVARAAVVGILFASGAVPAAALAEHVRDDCATEISLMCAGRKDIVPCLVKLGDDVTVRCKNALNEEPVPPSAPQVSRGADGPATTVVPKGVTAVPGAGNVWFKDDYAGPRSGLYPDFRKALSAEAPQALQEVARLLGQPGYRSAFPRPLVLRVEYDPTQQGGLGSLDSTGNRSQGQRVTFNMATWEDCPSRPIMRSVVTHELTHAVLHDLVGDGETAHVPQWFDEGLGMLAGGEPVAGIMLDAAYYRHGRGYPGALACRLDNEGPGLMGVGLITDCYAYYLLAVRHIAESSPQALPNVIADLRSGIAIEKSIPAHLGVPWSGFEEAVEDRVSRTFKWMSPFSRLTGRGWWRHVRWCRG